MATYPKLIRHRIELRESLIALFDEIEEVEQRKQRLMADAKAIHITLLKEDGNPRVIPAAAALGEAIHERVRERVGARQAPPRDQVVAVNE